MYHLVPIPPFSSFLRHPEDQNRPILTPPSRLRRQWGMLDPLRNKMIHLDEQNILFLSFLIISPQLQQLIIVKTIHD